MTAGARRPLTPGEVALARSVFGDAVDYGRVSLSRSKWAFFQPRHVVMAPLGCIHFHPGGTLWRDDEMIAAGLGSKTGRRMGHMSVSGEDGTMAALAPLGIGRRIFIHINNSYPMLLDDSPERAAVTAAGWDVAHDGMEIRL